MTEKYVAPSFRADGFHCPHCGVYAHQHWHTTTLRHAIDEEFSGRCSVSKCSKCRAFAVWLDDRMLYPTYSTAPLPEDDMPEDVKQDFDEARNAVNVSPRSAAALLRLSIQKLMPHLGEKGKNLNDDIGNLVKKGLREKIQQALDSVRVIGNEAVHPGQMDLKDDTQTAIALFELVNMIVETMITQPKKVEMLFSSIPESAREAIEKRDNGSP